MQPQVQNTIIRDLDIWGTDVDSARADLPDAYREFRYAGVWRLPGADEIGVHVFTQLTDEELGAQYVKLTEDQVATQLRGEG